MCASGLLKCVLPQDGFTIGNIYNILGVDAGSNGGFLVRDDSGNYVTVPASDAALPVVELYATVKVV